MKFAIFVFSLILVVALFYQPWAVGAGSDTRAEGLSDSGHDITPLPKEKVQELAKKLDREAYRITQKAGTEPAGTGKLLSNKQDGAYTCVVCGLPLFSSETKFDSGTGWPSFYKPLDPQHVAEKTDRSLGMKRTEVLCNRCDAHLGHVFNDGPKPTGLRYCLNSAALSFIEKGETVPEQSKPIKTETAYFAGGCFWGVEHYLQKGPGVIEVDSGYMQGHVKNPTYKQICTGTTGHAEAVKVVYDPSKITYKRLLQAFFKLHDPTQLNRQGPDHGEQYRSGVYAANKKQLATAKSYIDQLKKQDAYDRPIVTEVEMARTFWPAEKYHQDYIRKTGRACHVTNPW